MPTGWPSIPCVADHQWLCCRCAGGFSHPDGSLRGRDADLAREPGGAGRSERHWIGRFHDRKGQKYITLDMDSSVSPTHSEQEGTA